MTLISEETKTTRREKIPGNSSIASKLRLRYYDSLANHMLKTKCKQNVSVILSLSIYLSITLKMQFHLAGCPDLTHGGNNIQ